MVVYSAYDLRDHFSTIGGCVWSATESVLGPILFLLYTADLLQLVKSHHLNPHGFADDTQIDGFCKPSDAAALTSQLSVCIDDVSSWMMANRLQLNPLNMGGAAGWAGWAMAHPKF